MTKTQFPVRRLQNLAPQDLAEELSGQYEGDLIMPSEQMAELQNRNGRTGLLNLSYRWKDGIVPYRINETYFSK